MKLILRYICYTLIVVFIIGLIMSLHTRKSVLVNYLIPPADFYSPLSTSGVQFDKHGIIFETNFLNKYPGKHALVVYTDKAIKMEDSFSVNIENVVQVRLDGNIILEKQGRTYKSWMENYNGETGFFWECSEFCVTVSVPGSASAPAEVKVRSENGPSISHVGGVDFCWSGVPGTIFSICK
ncbi:MAG: hypothetical protein HUK40_18800 [Desulfobacter sp.]|nr:hypothetical protein [Desulfobacter sp.]